MNSATASRPIPLAVDRAEINLYLDSLVCLRGPAAGQPVFEAMRYAVLGSAQRIRPILALRNCPPGGCSPAATLAAAGAVELLHCASLIVDDLPCMDDSPFRRERASVHVEFGESTAILAAFALVALAARSLLECPHAHHDRERMVDFQLALLKTLDCCGLIAGQALDLASAAAYGPRADNNISDLKTVPLFKLAVQAGSLIEIRNPDSRAVLSGFGREFGLAFQMSDDLLDGEGQDYLPLSEKLSMLRALVAHFAPAAAILNP